MTGVVVRAADPAELPAAARVLALAFAQYRPAPSVVTPEQLERFDRYVADVADVSPQRGELFVAVADGTIVGCAALTRDSGVWPELGVWPRSWAILRRLGVHPEHRGRGIARRLVEARVARARELGAPFAAMHTSFEAARRLYRSLGWRRAPEYDIEPVPGVSAEAYVLPL